MNRMRTLFQTARAGLDRTGERFFRVIHTLFAAAFEPCRVPVPAPIPARWPRPNWRALAPALVAAIALLPASAGADPRGGTRDAVTGDLVEVRVKVEGQAAPLYVRPGDWSKRYLQAFRGRHYSLELRNLTDRRIGVAISVDGINVVNGERTGLSSDESMYVLDPFERAEIRGWRTSLNDVRRFVFVDEERSYASRTDQANGDMGWIRVHAFREWRQWTSWGRLNLYRGGGESVPAPSPPSDQRARREEPESKSEVQEGSQSPAAPEAGSRMDAMRQAPQADAFPGTGWGDRRNDPVRRVDFRAEREAADRLVFRYEYESGLRALGIFPRRSRLWEREDGQLGFAKPPRW